MANKSKYSEMFWPVDIYEGQRILNENGLIETIYGIEKDSLGNYISTIATDDERCVILKTYFVKENKKESAIKKVAGKKENLLKNLEKAALNDIEKKIGLNALASQLN